jgi:serine/threonine protein phosphatase PrpC
MQGWRKGMEDSHIAALDIENDISVFGVFDGHGGCEVAKFV